MDKDDYRKVVVVTRATVIKSDNDVFAVRFKKLGLTAYGHTKSEGLHNLKIMFNRFIHTHRKAGTLVNRLEQAGVEWAWVDEYTGSYEDTNVPESEKSEDTPNVAEVLTGTETLLSTAA
jgi:hypothetical protein